MSDETQVPETENVATETQEEVKVSPEFDRMWREMREEADPEPEESEAERVEKADAVEEAHAGGETEEPKEPETETFTVGGKMLSPAVVKELREAGLLDRVEDKAPSEPEVNTASKETPEVEAPGWPELSEEDRAELDPKVVSYMDATRAQFEAMKKEHAEMQSFVREVQRTSLQKQVDFLFEKSKDDYPDAKKQDVLEKISDLAAGYHARGKDFTLEQIHKEALAVLYPDAKVNKREKQLSEKLRDRSGQFTSRPTQHHGPSSLSAEERAAKAIAPMLAD